MSYFKKHKWTLIIIVLILGIYSVNVWHNSFVEQPEVGFSKNDVLLAYKYAADKVRINLKSPSSAIFPNTRERMDHTLYKGDGIFIVNSWVEAMNSFGGYKKIKFSCQITFIDKTYQISKLVIEE